MMNKTSECLENKHFSRVHIKKYLYFGWRQEIQVRVQSSYTSICKADYLARGPIKSTVITTMLQHGRVSQKMAGMKT